MSQNPPENVPEVASHDLFGLADIRALRELLPPKRGEFLRCWMLRCTCLGLVKKEEALRIKTHNPEAWNVPYVIEPNEKCAGTDASEKTL